MAKEMLINVSEGEECRIALVENGRLEELYMERTSATSHVGNIYKGRVTNVEPSIQAAFIDFGLGRNGFLHISDLMPTYFGRRGEDVQETVGRKMARRDRPPIQRCLRRGDDIVVQIIKEGIGTKGPTLSTYVSIPGRILVMMPGMSKLGVSRKIEDDEERRRLRVILDTLKPPKDCGFIIRTAGVGRSKTDIQRDLQYLTRLWQNIEKKMASGQGPMELYTEGDLITRTVRDVFTNDIDRLIVDNRQVANRVSDFFKIALPRTKSKVELYEGTVPLFHKYGIEREIELMYSRHVPLPSGGSLVIDSTEAIVAIDVNSGKFRDHSDAEMTAFKTDMEAADEIPRQLRLRDLGGVIICDFIDLRYERHRRELEGRLHENLSHDRAKTKMLGMSEFGIIEMTRQRMRPSLKRSIYFDCPYCKGAGLVKTPESMALDVMRRLHIAINDQRVNRIELSVCPEVAFYLQNKKRASVASLEGHWKKRIIIRSEATMGLDAMHLELYDSRDGLVYLDELGMAPQLQAPAHVHQHARPPQQPQLPHQPQQRGGQQRQDQRGGGGRGGDRRDQRDPRGGGRGQQQDQRGRDGRGDQRGGGGRRDQRDPRDQRGQQRDPRDPQRGRPQWDQPQQGRDQYEHEEVEDQFEAESVEEAVAEREERMLEEVREPTAPPPPPLETIEPVEVMTPDMDRSPEPFVWDEHDEDEGAGDAAAPLEETGRVAEAAMEQDAAEDVAQARGRRSRGRRGRGRRGRGGGGGNQSQQQQQRPPQHQRDVWEAEVRHQPPPVEVEQEEQEAPPVEVVAPVEREPAPEPEPVEAEAPKATPKRKRGGTRVAGTTKKAAAKPAAKRTTRKKKTDEPKAEKAQRTPPTPAVEPVRPAAAVVVKTGSTDRHLIGDEPVLPPPVSRPRTYRDLDAIPDDFD